MQAPDGDLHAYIQEIKAKGDCAVLVCRGINLCRFILSYYIHSAAGACGGGGACCFSSDRRKHPLKSTVTAVSVKHADGFDQEKKLC